MLNQKVTLSNGTNIVIETPSIRRRGEQYYLCRVPEGYLVEYSDSEIYKSSDIRRMKPVTLVKDGETMQFVNYRHMKAYDKTIDLGKSELQYILDKKGISSNTWEYEPELITDYNNTHDYNIYISPIHFR